MMRTYVAYIAEDGFMRVEDGRYTEQGWQIRNLGHSGKWLLWEIPLCDEMRLLSTHSSVEDALRAAEKIT